MAPDQERHQDGELRRVFLGLGSNLGDRHSTLRNAVAAIPEVRAVSPVYETDPVGGPSQEAFLNIVVELRSWRSARNLLKLCHELEQDANRERSVRWGPRTLDVDVLYIEGESIDEPDLVVPHPRMHERNFVMTPLLDLDSSLRTAIRGYDSDTAIGEVTVVGPL